LTKKILLTGPESSGKTTLAKQLADHYASLWRPEYAREYLTLLGRAYTIDDLTTILREQQQRQAAMLSTAPDLLFCDTGPEVLYIWSKAKYSQVAPEIIQQLTQEHYDLRLLCYPDLEWEADLLRETPKAEDRLALWQEYVALHEQHGWDYTVIIGENRLEQAIAAVEVLLDGQSNRVNLR
jgi:NadR type nicotinamide-nucleotide adenylyltransferase